MNIAAFCKLSKWIFSILVLVICLYGFSLLLNSRGLFYLLLQDLYIRLTLFFCLAIGFGVFCFLIFKPSDLLLIILWLFVVDACFTDFTINIKIDCIIFLAALLVGRLHILLLITTPVVKCSEAVFYFLAGLIVILASGSWWYLDLARKFYPGTRWTGLWNNPNDYGILMSIGVLLAVGLLTTAGWKFAGGSWRAIILLIAAGMMAAGLFFSCSRGAWLGLIAGLLYMAKINRKLKWRFHLGCIFIPAALVWHFSNSALDTSEWYAKRMDFSRPSVQHRIAACKAGLEIMRDHPFCIGWNKTIYVYEKSYSPPENGAGAITTNDYLMIGTQLGVPALLCFLGYVALQLRVGRLKLADAGLGNLEFQIKLACRAAVLAMLIEFGLMGGFSSYPRRRRFGFCWNWEGWGKAKSGKAGKRRGFNAKARRRGGAKGAI